MKLYKYYSIHRPVSIGTYPKKGMQYFMNFDFRAHVEKINRDAWGWLAYDRPLTEKECRDYELFPGGII